MSKLSNSRRCVYCLEYHKILTEDHVFPLSWYPNTTPYNIEKWKVPACKNCNEKYGNIERNLLIRLGLCVDPVKSESRGIAQKALRALNPLYGKNTKDQIMRNLTRKKIQNHMVHLKEIPTRGLFPGFGPTENISEAGYTGILLSSDELKVLGCKLVRGITYFLDQTFIENDYRIEVFFVADINAQDIIKIIDKFGTHHNCGHGIKIGRAVPPDAPRTALFAIEIWDKLKMYATVKKNQ